MLRSWRDIVAIIAASKPSNFIGNARAVVSGRAMLRDAAKSYQLLTKLRNSAFTIFLIPFEFNSIYLPRCIFI
jgi:hypothetical protein